MSSPGQDAPVLASVLLHPGRSQRDLQMCLDFSPGQRLAFFKGSVLLHPRGRCVGNKRVCEGFRVSSCGVWARDSEVLDSGTGFGAGRSGLAAAGGAGFVPVLREPGVNLGSLRLEPGKGFSENVRCPTFSGVLKSFGFSRAWPQA